MTERLHRVRAEGEDRDRVDPVLAVVDEPAAYVIDVTKDRDRVDQLIPDDVDDRLYAAVLVGPFGRVDLLPEAIPGERLPVGRRGQVEREVLGEAGSGVGG